MATEEGGRACYESGGAVEKLRKRPIRTLTETSRGISDEGGNSGSWKSKLGQMLKQVTVTMFKVQHPITMEDLPDEILVNIFIRLQAKQLGQMRSVSKSWNAFLSQPSFVKSHLQCSTRNNNEQVLLVFANELLVESYHERFKQYSYKSSDLEPINFIKHTPNNLYLRKEVIGCVNGLICLAFEHSYFDIRIWNPSLSAMSTIPPPHSIISGSLYSNNMRFGFDRKTNDYKLVNFSGVRDSGTVIKASLKVEVYSSRKGCWEFINQPFPSSIRKIHNSDYVCADGHDGHLHWYSITSGSSIGRAMLAFDLGTETFSAFLFPDSILDSNHKWHRLGVLDGKLCLMSSREDDVCEVWVMEEYGVPKSWIKHHVLSQFNGPWRAIYGFTSRNELLLNDKDGLLILYDLIADKTKSTRTQQIVDKVVEYVDSLAWI